VAERVKNNTSFSIPDELLAQYSEEDILEGCVHIISAEISANVDLRTDLIDTLEAHGTIGSKLK
jgi:hypothetical protein